MRLGGDEGLLTGMLIADLEHNLETELTDHVGYQGGDPNASLSRTRATRHPEKVSIEIGDVELTVPETATTHSPATQAFLSAGPYVRCRM
jgi:hypothetical protein